MNITSKKIRRAAAKIFSELCKACKNNEFVSVISLYTKLVPGFRKVANGYSATLYFSGIEYLQSKGIVYRAENEIYILG